MHQEREGLCFFFSVSPLRGRRVWVAAKEPHWALKTHRAMVSREFSKCSVSNIEESDKSQGINKQTNEQTNKQITKCPGYCMDNSAMQFQRNNAIVEVHFNTGWNCPSDSQMQQDLSLGPTGTLFVPYQPLQFECYVQFFTISQINAKPTQLLRNAW